MANSGREIADYSCPSCGHSRLPRDNGPQPIFKCPKCGRQVHEAVAENADALEALAEADDAPGRMARALLETGGVVE